MPTFLRAQESRSAAGTKSRLGLTRMPTASNAVCGQHVSAWRERGEHPTGAWTLAFKKWAFSTGCRPGAEVRLGQGSRREPDVQRQSSTDQPAKLAQVGCNEWLALFMCRDLQSNANGRQLGAQLINFESRNAADPNSRLSGKCTANIVKRLVLRIGQLSADNLQRCRGNRFCGSRCEVRGGIDARQQISVDSSFNMPIASRAKNGKQTAVLFIGGQRLALGASRLHER